MIEGIWLLLPLAGLASLAQVAGRAGLVPRSGGVLPRSLVLWGLVSVLLIELLSLFNALSQVGLAVGWLVVIGVSFGLARAIKGRGRSGLQTEFRMPARPTSRALAGAVVLILATTAVVAWLAPPQTWDSLNYHLPRIAHWAQQGSVDHFATGIEVQNSRAPGAEYLMLHSYLLSAGDRFLTWVGWMAFAASLAMVGMMGQELGAQESGVWMAVLFGATLPMAIIQASGTANDLVTALWVLVFAWEAIHAHGSRPLRAADFGFMGGAVGLALLTKPTAFPYLLPFAVWVAVRAVRQDDWRRLALGAILAAALVGVVNAPYLARNYGTYGAVLQQEQVEIHSNQLRTPAGVLSNTLKNAALHASTPVPLINRAVFLAVVEVHDWMGLDPNDPRTIAHQPFRVHSFSTHEERSGNTLHAILLVLILGWLVSRRRSIPGRIWIYLAGAASTFVLFSALFQWQVFGSRYHLPFFLLWGPIAGWVAGRWRGTSRMILAAIMALGSVPWLVSIRSRPLFPIPGEVSAPSVLEGDRRELRFTNGERLRRPYEEMVDLIEERSCSRIGLALSGSGAEYPLWSLLDAPDPSLSVQWLVAGTDSAKYADPEFDPCAVICWHCDEESSFAGLPKTYERSDFQLFLE